MSQPLSTKELDELRDVASYEAKGVRVRALVLSMRRLLATIEARDHTITEIVLLAQANERDAAALEAKLANIRKLCDDAQYASSKVCQAAMTGYLNESTCAASPCSDGIRGAAIAFAAEVLDIIIDAKPRVEET